MLMESKLQICHILNMICDVRLNLRLTEVLRIYKIKYNQIVEVQGEETEEETEEEKTAAEKKYDSTYFLPKDSPCFIPTRIPISKSGTNPPTFLSYVFLLFFTFSLSSK